MLTYRRIDDDIRFAEYVWTIEQTLPAWFIAASEAWCKDLSAFLKFWQDDCDEIWGLFDEDRPDDLLACVYLEYLGSPAAVNIHVSKLGDVPSDELTRFFRSLKNYKAGEGVRVMTAWTLRNNKALLSIAQAAGFTLTGLRMIYGGYRGRSLEWLEMRG